MVGEAHYYTTELEGELVLFDTGPPTLEGLEHLKRNVDLSRLRHVFITHCHVDHFGLAGYLEQNSGARIYVPRLDSIKLSRQKERRAALVGLLIEAGFDESFANQQRSISIGNHLASVPPTKYGIVEESDIFQKLGFSYLSCPGHSQGDTVYLVGDAAVTGDLLLRNIFQTPVLEIDLETFKGRYPNYPSYCKSLPILATLEGRRVLPGHRTSIDGVRATIGFYVTKLLERAAKVRRYSDVEKVSDVVKQIFGDAMKDPFVIFMKVSEIYFMRDFLAQPELLRLALEEIGLFSRIRELYEKSIQQPADTE